MTQAFPQSPDIFVRPIQYSDLDAVERFRDGTSEAETLSYSIHPDSHLKPLHHWYGPLKILGLLINRPQVFGAYLAERDSKLQGLIQISPFNRTRSTWRVDRVAAMGEMGGSNGLAPSEAAAVEGADATETATLAPSSLRGVGSLLLRHCFATVWEARNWILEANVNDKDLLALYRQNGFQPLAHMTYWQIDSQHLQELAEREPDLPNLLPVGNADAQLLYQLDTMSMPPLLRQIFDRHITDFKTSLVGSVLQGVKNWLNHMEVVSAYVFEPQRKAAIAYFQMQLCRDGSRPHQAQLTVNPAYTWLYPELMAQMAQITQDFPAQALQLASSDYQPEREEHLERFGATRIAHTLMMSRSVWHKVRESKLGALENLQLPEVLQGLKPSRKAIPSRITLLEQSQDPTRPDAAVRYPKSPLPAPRPTKPVLNLSPKTDFSEPPQEGPCC